MENYNKCQAKSWQTIEEELLEELFEDSGETYTPAFDGEEDYNLFWAPGILW